MPFRWERPSNLVKVNLLTVLKGNLPWNPNSKGLGFLGNLKLTSNYPEWAQNPSNRKFPCCALQALFPGPSPNPGPNFGQLNLGGNLPNNFPFRNPKFAGSPKFKIGRGPKISKTGIPGAQKIGPFFPSRLGEKKTKPCPRCPRSNNLGRTS